MPVIFGVTLTASAKLGRAPPCKALKARGFLHAGLDPALAGLNLTAEMRDIGLACLKDRPRTGPHLRHRARCGEQQDSAGHQDFLRQHDRCSIAYTPPRAIALHYYSAGALSRKSFLLNARAVRRAKPATNNDVKRKPIMSTKTEAGLWAPALLRGAGLAGEPPDDEGLAMLRRFLLPS